jgi:hypothetical protein
MRFVDRPALVKRDRVHQSGALAPRELSRSRKAPQHLIDARKIIVATGRVIPPGQLDHARLHDLLHVVPCECAATQCPVSTSEVLIAPESVMTEHDGAAHIEQDRAGVGNEATDQ